MLWRRSFDVPPPPIEDDSEWSQAGLPQYADLGDEMPRTECLKDVIARFLPYWESDIVPDLRAGLTVLVAAHGNSLRALVKHLDGISDEDIAGLNIPTGMPLVYELDDDMCPPSPGGRYLDPEAAAEAAAAVANQGRTRSEPRIRGASSAPSRAARSRRSPDPGDSAARCSRLVEQRRGCSPVTTKTTRLATETAWSAIRS